MRVIGTAGHVDHGKSTLVKRLTGIDPDRLAEEKAREMTIDLGFAWLTLPNDELIGIVDVPGHRDFIENMLAGVGGIDAVLLVIAADEGVMPQTREHLAILDLLGIEQGLVVLTKTDMVSDPDWLLLVEDDIRHALQATSLANAPILPVSAYNGDGIPQLIDTLTQLLSDTPRRPDYNLPRLSIDRVFTISGFGTVVTGTLLGGTLHVGAEVEIQPTGLKGRIRGLQSYKQSVEVAQPGSRVAVNVTGIEKRAIVRGHMLSRVGQLRPTRLVDVHFRHLPDIDRPLKHNAEIKFFCGAAETSGRVRLLNDESLSPGAEGWLQVRLDNPLPLTQHDRFILRYPSPAQTIGGGFVVNPAPGRRWRRFRSEVIQQLETRMQGSPAERVAQAAEEIEPIKQSVLQKSVGYSEIELQTAIQDGLDNHLLVQYPDGRLQAASTYNAVQRRMVEEIRAYHRANPLQLGMSREELRSRLGVKNATLNLLLDMQTDVVDDGRLLRLPDHRIRFTDKQEQAIAALVEHMESAPYTPPSYAEAVDIVGEDVLRALIDLGDIVQIQPDVIFAKPIYDEMVAEILNLIERDGSITAKSLRDHFNTSRKYAIGLLEHTDALGITQRVGDERVRGRQAANR